MIAINAACPEGTQSAVLKEEDFHPFVWKYLIRFVVRSIFSGREKASVNVNIYFVLHPDKK